MRYTNVLELLRMILEAGINPRQVTDIVSRGRRIDARVVKGDGVVSLRAFMEALSPSEEVAEEELPEPDEVRSFTVLDEAWEMVWDEALWIGDGRQAVPAGLGLCATR